MKGIQRVTSAREMVGEGKCTFGDTTAGQRGCFLDLSLDSGFSVGEEAFREIVRRFKDVEAKRIVEFGSGVSTARLAIEFPSARILSVEHSRDFMTVTAAYVKSLERGEGVKLDLRPAEWRRVGPGVALSYAKGEFPVCVDAVLVDGPPGWMHRGREACLYDVWKALRVGGVLILDDYERRAERAAGAAWRVALGAGAEFEDLPVGHRLLVVRKAKSSCPALWRRELAGYNLVSWWYYARSIAGRTLKGIPRGPETSL